MQLNVRSYSELERWGNAFANDHLQVLIVVGSAGL